MILLFGCLYCCPADIRAVDGDLAPWGAPDCQLNAADLFTMQRIVLGEITATPLDYQNGDLYPPAPGPPDGVINVSDLILLYGLVNQSVQVSTPVAVDDPAAATTAEYTAVTTANVLANDILVDNALISSFPFQDCRFRRCNCRLHRVGSRFGSSNCCSADPR